MDKQILRAKHLSIGGIVYGVVTALWLVWEFAFGTVQNQAITGLASVAIVLLVFTAVFTLAQSPSTEAQADSKDSMWFGIIFAWEGIGIGVASGILIALEMVQWLPVATAIIVGLHFFPLGRLLNITADYVIGAVLILIAVIVPLTVANSTAWVSLICFVSAFTLYVSGWMRVLMSRRLLSSVEMTQTDTVTA
ncbi:MAG: hypothetical protein AAFQ07_01265 [Chloroflexota bacterium]